MVVKRAHTADNIAPAISVLRKQFDASYPHRDKASDGIWPSAAHSKANPNSDHEAGNALDIDDDLSGKDRKGAKVSAEMAQKLSVDGRCKYAIHDGVIYKNGLGSKYRGSNPHTGHIHVSVYEKRRRDNSPWQIFARITVVKRTMGARKHSWWASRVLFKVTAGRSVWVLGTASNGWVYIKDHRGRCGWLPPYAVS